jgi:uncharacterized protein YjbI with pentapeptide repeats
MYRTDLSYANLRNANLSYANLNGALLVGADLKSADLTGADLKEAKYNSYTKWPEDFDPEAAGAEQVD